MGACTTEDFNTIAINEIPDHFPELVHPEDNDYSYDRWSLGKSLFFDPVMSRDSSISCASCHLQEFAFSDKNVTSIGIENRVGTRNVPPLFNLAYHPYFTREGSVPTLEMQVLVPIQEHDEMDFNIVLIAERLNMDSSYVRMSQEAYGRNPDAFVISRALACFERSLISGQSKYDDYLLTGRGLTDDEIAGEALFFDVRLKCAFCHSGFNFTNYSFQNNGLYTEYDDPGRFRFSQDSSELSVFKVPSLRNIELTAPYMHDGSMETLEEIIDHYASGGANHFNKSNYIDGFEISDEEKQQLISFLKSLTDQEFINNPNFYEN